MNDLLVAKDEALRKRILGRLKSRGDPALKQRECLVENRVVVNSGVIDTFYLTQLAQEAVKASCHGRQIENRVEVV
jgi:hypothetical protein